MPRAAVEGIVLDKINEVAGHSLAPQVLVDREMVDRHHTVAPAIKVAKPGHGLVDYSDDDFSPLNRAGQRRTVDEAETAAFAIRDHLYSRQFAGLGKA